MANYHEMDRDALTAEKAALEEKQGELAQIAKEKAEQKAE